MRTIQANTNPNPRLRTQGQSSGRPSRVGGGGRAGCARAHRFITAVLHSFPPTTAYVHVRHTGQDESGGVRKLPYMRSARLELRIDPELLERIDRAAGDVPRSRW